MGRLSGSAVRSGSAVLYGNAHEHSPHSGMDWPGYLDTAPGINCKKYGSNPGKVEIFNPTVRSK